MPLIATEAFKSGMIAQDHNLSVIANNMANVKTTGYRSLTAQFQDVMYQTLSDAGAQSGSTQTPQPLQLGYGTQISATTTDFTAGSLELTGNPFDMALIGGPSSYFQVEKDGVIYYTRDGSFKRSATGLLVTSDGYPLIPNITVPAGSQVTITENGTVNALQPGQTDPQALGQIQLAMFINPSGLTRKGRNLLQSGAASGAPNVGSPGENGIASIQAGYLEGSNVSIVDQMVNMMTAQRAFELCSKGVETADEMAGRVTR